MGIEKQEMIKTPHILAISMPFQGHLSPMLQFSKRLASKGLRVTLIVTTNTVSHAESKLSCNTINVEHISFEFEEGQRPKNVEEYVEHMKRKGSETLPMIVDKLKDRGYPVDVLVHDSLMPWAVDLGHRLGLKVAQYFTQACSVCAIYYHVYLGRIKRYDEVNSDVISLPAIPELEVRDLPSDIVLDLYPGTTEYLASQFSCIHKADWIFFNTFVELEKEIVKWLSSQWPIMTIGPSIPSMFLDKRLPDDTNYGLSLFKPDSEACIKWLNAKDNGSVVYVSFGSLANVGEDQMAEIAWGLLNSNNNFLWVVRETEQSKLPSDFIAEAKGKGLVVSWCPQLEVLDHSAVGSFMTHCGWNSTLEALGLGVPMIVMPQLTDQTTNAKYIVDVWKTGVRVTTSGKSQSFMRDDIAKCIKDVMHGEKGEELKANAIKWKDLSVEAMSEGGSSDKNIDDFISKVMSYTTY